jgi:hypothetical protein
MVKRAETPSATRSLTVTSRHTVVGDFYRVPVENSGCMRGISMPYEGHSLWKMDKNTLEQEFREKRPHTHLHILVLHAEDAG